MLGNAGIAGSLWTRLQDGNLRWIEDRSAAHRNRGAARRAEISRSQEPFALVLGCSDSRVPAEILFDQGLGDIFVVRTAGHVVDSAALGSIEYAIEVLGTRLIVVLGHEECGALAAAARLLDDAQLPPGHIRDIAERIAPNILRARSAGATTATDIGGQHAIYTVEHLAQRSQIVHDAIERGTVSAVPALYSLTTGAVTEIGLLALTGA